MSPVTIHLPMPIHGVDVLGRDGGNGLDERAAEQVAAIRAEYEQQVAQARQEAREQLAALQQTLQQTFGALQQASEQLDAHREELTVQMQREAVDLAMLIARRVVHAEIQARRHDVDAMVREALAQLPSGIERRIRLNPDDHQRCRQAGAEDSETLQYLADPDVPAGHCIVESCVGTVEHHPAEALDTIETTLQEEA